MVDITLRRRAVDKDYFEKINKGYVSEANGAPSINQMPFFHWERGRLTDLDNSTDDHTISHTFLESFLEIPITNKFEVYRFADMGGGKYRKQEVLYYHAEDALPSLTGFEIEIEDFEDLTGVIIEFVFLET